MTPVGTDAPPDWEEVELALADDDAAAPVALPLDAPVALPVLMTPGARVPLAAPVMVAFPVAATRVPLLARVEATVPLM